MRHPKRCRECGFNTGHAELCSRIGECASCRGSMCGGYDMCKCSCHDDGRILPSFERWWSEEGYLIDPDTHDVSWFDKRKGLAAIAYAAGFKSSKPASFLGLASRIDESES